MAGKQHLSVLLCVSLLTQALCVPADRMTLSRDIANNDAPKSNGTQSNTTTTSTTTEFDSFEDDDDMDEELMQQSSTRGPNIFNLLSQFTSLSSNSNSANQSNTTTTSTTTEFDSFEDDDDMDEELMQQSSTRGPNIFNLLSQFTSLSSNSNSANSYLWNIVRQFLGYNGAQLFLRRKDVVDNEIEIEEANGLKPPPPPSPTFQKQEIEELSSSSESEEDSNETDEKSAENDTDNASTSSDEYDEPPEGDGQGGGVLGILAGLSGGEDGQSDLGSLLATISSIVVNLSGDGIDVNALIASGLGLFVGLLSEGEENPGAVIGSYLLTSLDTLTGGGAQNNGAFFGNLVSKLVKGTSAAGEPDGSDEGNEGNKMADSAGFFLSLIMSLLGDMSKSSSGGSSQPSRRYEQIRRIYQADMNQNK